MVKIFSQILFNTIIKKDVVIQTIPFWVYYYWKKFKEKSKRTVESSSYLMILHLKASEFLGYHLKPIM